MPIDLQRSRLAVSRLGTLHIRGVSGGVVRSTAFDLGEGVYVVAEAKITLGLCGLTRPLRRSRNGSTFVWFSTSGTCLVSVNLLNRFGRNL